MGDSDTTEYGPAAFLECLKSSRLLAPVQRALVEGQAAQMPNPVELAGWVVEHGLLTRWQAEQLLAGRSRFFLGKHYKLTDKIGQGGMGAVYLAEQTSVGRTVAVKQVMQDLSNVPGALLRFRREIQAAAALNHPNIVRAFDADSAGGTHFLVMEYVKGRDVAQVAQEQGPFARRCGVRDRPPDGPRAAACP